MTRAKTKVANASYMLCDGKRPTSLAKSGMGVCSKCHGQMHVKADGTFPEHYYPTTTSYKYRKRF